MRYIDIITEDQTAEATIRDQLTGMLGLSKAKGMKSVPLDTVLSGVTYNGQGVNNSDMGAVNDIIDIITSLDNLVKEVRDGVVYIKTEEDKKKHSATAGDADKDEEDVKKAAADQADKNIKDN